MGFRSPLRNEWERVAPQFADMAKSPGRDGVMARLMGDAMPMFVAAVERERDRATLPRDFFDAVAAVCGAMIEEAIEKHQVMNFEQPGATLDRMLSLINRTVRPRVAAPKPSRLIVPEG